jgi:glycosyltransferase involved in cell wall biosynthesis
LDCIGADRKGLSGYLYRKLWFEIPVLRAAVVTTISEYSKMDIVRYTACDPKKIVVTGVAIHSRYHPYPKSFDKDCPRMLQVGTAPNKNIERVAFALRGISCHLVIVGRLSESQEVALRENSIEFTCYDRLSDHELSEQYKSCDLVVFASTFEGFGMPILEANAIGRAVITGNCTSMPEVGGDAACFVDPFDVASIRAGVVKVCNDDGFRESLVANGYKNVERFNPDVVAERYLTVYESLPRFNQRDTSGAKL